MSNSEFRIAFFLDDFPSATQTFILSQMNGIIEQGFKVDLYALRSNTLEKIHLEISKYDLQDKVVYLPLAPKKKFSRVLEGLASFNSYKAWRTPGPLLRSLNLLKYRPALLHYFRILPLLKSGPKEYDIIHCQFGTVAALAMELMQIGVLKGKLITSIRGHDITSKKKRSIAKYNKLFTFGDLFLPVSLSLKEKLIEEGCPKNKIKILHSGIDCEKFEFKPRILNPGETIRLVSTARLVEMKGITYAIDAVAQLLKKGIDVSYDVLGDGELKNVLQEQIDNLHVGKSIKLRGWMSHDEVKDVLSSSHIFLAPSVTASNGEMEGIPNAVKEAMAQGIPVVGTYHSGIPELVQDGLSGYLVPEKDVNKLADKIEMLVKQPQRWGEMGASGRQYILEEFDIISLNKKLAGIYTSLV